MALSTRMTATASRLINKYGTPVVLTTYVDGSYDPTTSLTARTSSVVNLVAVIEEYADSIRFLGNKEQTGTLIQEGDKKITIAGSDLNYVAPNAGMGKFTVNSIDYNIIGVASQFVDIKIAYFVFHVRQT